MDQMLIMDNKLIFRKYGDFMKEYTLGLYEKSMPNYSNLGRKIKLC